MTQIKQGTVYVQQFQMILSSDHVSPATGKSPVVKLGKNGATGVTGGNSPATEVDSTNLPGWYSYIYSTVDTNTAGSLAFHATAASCDNTDFKDDIQAQVVQDISLNNLGQVLIASNVKQNTAILFPFIMTVAGVPTAGLTGFVAQRNLAGAGFAPCANAVVEDASGWYHILLAAADTNAAVVEIHITAPTADDRNITLYTQP